MTTTTNLAEFGYRERKMAADILNAINENGLPNDFEDDEIQIMFNKMSGNVFLTNSEYQVAMFNDDEKLELFYSTPYSGYEGFYSDLIEQYKNGDWHKEDVDYLKDLATSRGNILPRLTKKVKV